MARISVRTDQVRSLGRVLDSTAADLARTKRRVESRQRAIQLNTTHDPQVARVISGTRRVESQLQQLSRTYDALGQNATTTAKRFELADRGFDIGSIIGRVLDDRLWGSWLRPFPRSFRLPRVIGFPAFPPQPARRIPQVYSALPWDGFRPELWSALRWPAHQVVRGVGQRRLDGVRGMLGRVVGFADRARSSVGDRIEGVGNWVDDGLSWVKGGLKSAWNWGKDRLTTLIKDAWNGIWTTAATRFREVVDGIQRVRPIVGDLAEVYVNNWLKPKWEITRLLVKGVSGELPPRQKQLLGNGPVGVWGSYAGEGGVNILDGLHGDMHGSVWSGYYSEGANSEFMAGSKVDGNLGGSIGLHGAEVHGDVTAMAGLYGKLYGEQRYGPLSLDGKIETMAGVRAAVGGGVGVDLDGTVTAKGSASATAGVEVSGEGNADLGPLGLTAKGRAVAGAEASAKGEVSVGKDGVKAGAEFEAFAGYKTEGEIRAGLGDSVDAGVGGDIGVGIGVEANIDAEVSLDKVGFQGEIGGYLGIGGSISVDISVSPKGMVDDVVDIGDAVVDFF